MPHDAAWLEEQRRRLASKRELLSSLEEKLAAWQTEHSLDDLPPAKRAALEALALESRNTLTSMIEQVAAGLPADPRRNGQHSPALRDERRG